jgi:hypothetical protein
MKEANSMSRRINVIQRSMIPQSNAASVEPHASTFVGEWQQRGPETISGHAFRKLRFTFSPAQFAATAGLVG